MAKVLILDQSKSMRNTLRERLEYEGFSTEAAEDEEAASNMCEKIPFDVILSDTGCKIPDKGVPFIVLSSEASIDSAVEAVRNGAQDYLTKPIDMNRLLQSIHRTAVQPPADCRGRFFEGALRKTFDGLFQRQAKKQTGKRKQNTDLNSVGIFYCLFCGFVQVVDKVLGLHLQSGGGVSAFGRHGTGISEKREISPQKLFGKLSVPEGKVVHTFHGRCAGIVAHIV